MKVAIIRNPPVRWDTLWEAEEQGGNQVTRKCPHSAAWQTWISVLALPFSCFEALNTLLL